MRDKLIISPIAISQFLLSLALMGIALYGLPLLFVFGLWGLVNACALFSSSIFPRVAALIWHLMFVGYILIASIGKPLDNAGNKTLVLWALVDLAAIFYLAKVTLHYVRNRPNPQRSDPASREP